MVSPAVARILRPTREGGNQHRVERWQERPLRTGRPSGQVRSRDRGLAGQALPIMSTRSRRARHPSSRAIRSARPTMRAGSPGRLATTRCSSGFPVTDRTVSRTSRTLLPPPRPTL